MYPRKKVVDHPPYNILLEYATVGCLVDCGEDWSEEYMIVAIKHGLHSSTIQELVLHVLHREVEEKVTQGYAKKPNLENLDKIYQKI